MFYFKRTVVNFADDHFVKGMARIYGGIYEISNLMLCVEFSVV
jgi:hypothetical protein